MEEKLCRDRFGYAVKKLREMRKNKIFTDVVLECQGGSMHAHRCVLMAASPFFYNLLTSNLVGDNLIEIEFETISISVIEAIVASFYGEIYASLQNDTHFIQKVLETCQNMHEELLIDYCINSLIKHLSLQNCFHFWELTVKYENCEAEECVMTFILNHLGKLMEMFGYKFGKLSIDQIEALITFAKEESLDGEHLASAIISWGKCSLESTVEKIIAFFCLLDMSKLSRSTIKELMNDEFVHNSQELMQFLASFSIGIDRDLHQKQDLQLHFSYNCLFTDGKIVNQAFSLEQKKWCAFDTIQLPVTIAKDWFPLIALTGDKFYFAVSCEKKFVAYNEKNHQIYTGPSVTLENQVTGVVDGTIMYIWNYEKLVKFEIDTKIWKLLSPIVNVISRSNLLATNGMLFYHATSLPSILKYDFVNNEWEFKRSVKELTNLVSIRCKCLRKKCKKKLYFVRDEKHMMSYDTEKDMWTGKYLPELNNSQPLFMNCDEPFIVFGDRFHRNSFFIYYPEINMWSSFQTNDFTWQNTGFSCDICLK